LDTILQRRFRQDFLPVFDLNAARLQNAVEHGSSVGLSTHRGNFCMLEREMKRVKSVAAAFGPAPLRIMLEG
jgi:hypothetical protein